MDEEDDEYAPILPTEPKSKAKSAEPPPLPRLWKTPPEASETEDAPVPKRKKSAEPVETAPTLDKSKKKKKVLEEVIDDGTGAVKLEETPVLDTYEARQRARWIIGGVLVAIASVGCLIVWKAFKGSGVEEVREGEPPSTATVVDSKSSVEKEARVLLDMARRFDKQGKPAEAMRQLEKLAKSYQGTAASREAMHAIDRGKHDKTLFEDEALAAGNGPKPPPPGSTIATGPATPKSVTGTNPATTPEVTPSPSPSPAPIIAARPLPAGYRAKFDFPIHASGWPTRISCDHDGAELVLVPGAIFLMGREDGEPAERPVHQVQLSPYYIDKHEVTVRQYVNFLKETGRLIDLGKLAPKDARKAAPSDDEPVVNISAREAKAYCTWAGRTLPTEAQWELAARGPELRISYWNGELPRKDPARGDRPMEPVMSLSSDLSPYGAFDMAANAWEWTQDYYDSRYFERLRNLSRDPTGPKEPPSKIALVAVKGGSSQGILTWREGREIAMRKPYIGFRGALQVEFAPVVTPVAPAGPAGPGSPQKPGQVPF